MEVYPYVHDPELGSIYRITDPEEPLDADFRTKYPILTQFLLSPYSIDAFPLIPDDVIFLEHSSSVAAWIAEDYRQVFNYIHKAWGVGDPNINYEPDTMEFHILPFRYFIISFDLWIRSSICNALVVAHDPYGIFQRYGSA